MRDDKASVRNRLESGGIMTHCPESRTIVKKSTEEERGQRFDHPGGNEEIMLFSIGCYTNSQ